MVFFAGRDNFQLEDVSSFPFLQKGDDTQLEDAISVGNRTGMETNDHVFVARLEKSLQLFNVI